MHITVEKESAVSVFLFTVPSKYLAIQIPDFLSLNHLAQPEREGKIEKRERRLICTLVTQLSYSVKSRS